MKQFIICISIVGCLVGCYSSEPQINGKEGKPLPEFNILLTDSTTWINTANATSKRPVVLFYFSPFCPYCKKQTKEIIEDITTLTDIQFYFISSYPISALKAFKNEYNLAKYPNITTGMDTANVVGDYFEIIGVPYLAIYGKDKKLNKCFLGGKLYSSKIKELAEE